MFALALEETVVDLDQALWQVWKAMDVPQGFRAEIIEGPSRCHPLAEIAISPSTGGSTAPFMNT